MMPLSPNAAGSHTTRSFLFSSPLALSLGLAGLLLLSTLRVQGQDITGGLKAYWSMDAATGGTVADQSAGGHTGTLTGNAAISTQGKVGGCLEMPARQDGYVPFSTLTWQPTAFSVAFWINPASHSDYSNQLGSSIGWGGFIFHTDPAGRCYAGTDVATRITSNPGAVVLGEWQHFTFTYDGTTGRLYKDGALLEAKPMAAPLAWGGFYVGNPGAGGTLHGRIDEVRIYGRAITSREVELLLAYPHVPTTHTWNGSAGTNWNTAANWTPAAVPTAHDDVTVNYCTACPQLAADAAVASLTLNTGAVLDLASRRLQVSGRAWLAGATINAAGGTFRAGSVPTLWGCTFNGPLTLHRAGVLGGVNITDSWHGNNIFNGPLTLNSGIAPDGVTSMRGWIHDIAAGNIFNADVTINVYGFGLRLGFGGSSTPNRFAGKLTVNFISDSYWVVGLNNGEYLGEVTLNNESGGTLALDGGNTFRRKVTLNNRHPPPQVTYQTYGNFINVSLWPGQVNTFEGPVEVTNTSRRSAAYAPVNVTFGGGTSVFRSTAASQGMAALSVGAAGFLRGTLQINGCVFENPVPIGLTLTAASGLPAPVLAIGGGTSFTGPLTATAPRLQVGGSTFKGEASFTKTGEGADNWAGGNVFKRKLTLTNQAGAASPVNMGLQADDVIDGTQ